MCNFVTKCAAGLSLALLIAPGSQAHHSYAMFDRNKSVTYDGVVSVWQNINPHALLWIYINDEKGTPQLWGLEGPGPQILLRNGMDKYAVKPGDKITVTINPLKDGRNGGNIEKIVLTNGKVIDVGKLPSEDVVKQ